MSQGNGNDGTHHGGRNRARLYRLPTAAVLATHGAIVIGVDVNEDIVDAVNRGEVPFVEPDLSISVAGAVKQGRLRAESKTPEADVYIVAVPTPSAEGHQAALPYIDSGADGLAERLPGDELAILESTSPLGNTQHMADRILALRPDLSLDRSLGRPMIHVAHCPEPVLPGRIMIELVTNDSVSKTQGVAVHLEGYEMSSND